MNIGRIHSTALRRSMMVVSFPLFLVLAMLQGAYFFAKALLRDIPSCWARRP